MSTKELMETAPLLVVQSRLEASEQALMTAEAWQTLLKDCGVTSTEEATAALIEAASIVPLDNGTHYHVKPSQWVQDVLGEPEAVGFTALDIVQRSQAQHDAAVLEHTRHLRLLDGAVAKASRWRKCVWGGALLYSGAQLAVISRLTYVDLDWDIMEPVSYFLGTGTSLAFFLYVLKYRRDHSYDDFDKTMLPKQVRRFAPADFDWSAYEKAKDAVTASSAELQRVKSWAACH